MTSTLPASPSAPDSPTAEPGTATATTSPARPPATGAAPGVVTGRPRTWLRLEGLAIAAAALFAYSPTGAPWWLVPALFLVPDLSWLGYLAGNRVGAWTYNLAHTAPLPVALLAAGLAWDVNALTVAGVVGLVHVGLDRLMGYGVKHDDGFGHTHLGLTGPAAGQPRAHTHR
jgi:Domain of unknown function (DUF4260)